MAGSVAGGARVAEARRGVTQIFGAVGVKKLLEVFLGVLTAIGGFVDIGELVANTEAGARYGVALVWAVLLGLIVIMLYAEMAGRIATLAQRPVFDLVRERMGERAGLVNMLGAVAVN